MAKIRYLVISVFALCLGSCVGHHVTFFLPNTNAEAPGETRIFLDARGDLYPSGIPASYVLPAAAEGSLFEAARGADPALCRSAAAGSEMAQLCGQVVDRCSGSETEACFERWENGQAHLWEARSRALVARVSGEEDVTLALLIHGFNNWYRESNANYATAERQLRRFMPAGQRLHVVEVYWDGCRGNSNGVGCWGKAQSTGPLAGFALRQLFNGVETNWPAGRKYRWRVLTHSSGAFVAGAMFGDPAAALPQLASTDTNRWYARFRDHKALIDGPYGVPQARDIILGMFAAATPASTFTGDNMNAKGVLAPHLTILTALQPDDRGPNKAGLGCQRVGNSCLGVRRDYACDLQHMLAAREAVVQVTIYDFARDARIWGDESTLHDYSVYARQAADPSTFFRDFLATGPVPGDAGPLITC